MNHTAHKFRPYQYDMYRYAKAKVHPCLFADMRMGKTMVTHRTVSTYPANERKLVLVVAPFSTWDGWQEELNSTGIQPTFIDGPKKNRRTVLSEASEGWYIVNYESWRSVGPELRDTDWSTIILDESDMIKNPKSKVSKFFNDNFRFVSHRWCLTGTPDPESDLDFFQQIKFSDNTVFKERNFWAFKNAWCEVVGFDVKIRPRLQQKFREILADHCYFIKRSDVDMGGAQIVQKRFVRFDDKHSTMYETLESEFILESMEDALFKSTTEAFATFMWQRQLASGIVDGKISWKGKLEELGHLLTGQLKNEQVVVWASFDVELYAVKSFCDKLRISSNVLNGKLSHEDRTKLKHQFQNGKFQILIAQPEVFKYGTDLSAASTIIYFSLPCSGKTYRQSRDRTINIAKANSCLIIFLLTEGTIDEDLADGLESKLSRSELNHKIARGIITRTNKRTTHTSNGSTYHRRISNAGK